MKNKEIKIYKFPFTWWHIHIDELELKYLGAGMVKEETTPEEVWELCNWSCYRDDKPDNIKNIDIEVANSDLVIEMDDHFYIALPTGWKTLKTMEEVKRYLEERNYHDKDAE